ncbi:MAG TPA: hypothetical protein ENK33_06355 [Desulfobacterales bacterium]|nr:hypothetical protein [Desulfobacterales bacterium]
MAQSVFGFPDDAPVDLLNNAAAVTCFLSEVSGAMCSNPADPGLSEGGVFGLAQILNVIESTINEAAIKL